MACYQASSTIQYMLSDNTAQVVFVNMIASMNLFAISTVAFGCWGIYCSGLALGGRTIWSPLDLCSGSAGMDSAWSDTDNLLRRVDFWCLSSGGSIAPAGLWEFGSGGCAITVSAWRHFFASETRVVHNVLEMVAGAVRKSKSDIVLSTLAVSLYTE